MIFNKITQRVISYGLLTALSFSFFIAKPLEVHAESFVPTVEMISQADWTANSSVLLEEAITKYSAMGLTSMEAVAIPVGSALFAYGAMKGITYASENATEGALTLGRYMIDNIDTYDDEIQRYICSTILNVSNSGTEYYVDRSNLYSQRLMSSIDYFLGNTITADMAVNAGFIIDSSVISSDSLALLTQSQYESMVNRSITGKELQVSNSTMECIYMLPETACYLLVNSDGSTAKILDYAGNVLMGNGGALISHLVGYDHWYGFTAMTSYLFGGWAKYRIGSTGLKVLSGTSYVDAVGLTATLDMPFDCTTALEVPWTIPNDGDLVLPVETALNVGVGSLDITDVANVVPSIDNAGSVGGSDVAPPIDTSGFWSTLWTWLLNILNAIKSIPASIVGSIEALPTAIVDGIENFPQDIADSISLALTTLFVPSDSAIEDMQSLVGVKLPVIDQLSSWVDDVMEAIQHPDNYISNLSFNVDMSKARNTRWNYGGSNSNALDMSWYLEYKDTVDDIIIGIGWLIFLWNLHCQLPNIISAVGTVSFSNANLDYQKYSVSQRSAKMNKNKGGDSE